MTPNSLQGNLNLPLNRSSLIDQTKIAVGPNLANMIDFANLQKIYMWMMTRYIWPQVNARRGYERIWDLINDAYRLRLKIKDIKLLDDDKFLKTIKEKAEATGVPEIQITDTLIFDTVDRMANLCHFIAWKDGTPIQFNPPRYKDTPLEDRFYAPTRDKYKAMNAVLEFCIQKEEIYRKHRVGSKDHFKYGISFVLSELQYLLEEDPKKGTVVLKDIGVSYDPISIRRVWVNYLLPLADMNKQACPFWYEYAPEFAILQNVYEPVTNPFGFVNQEQVSKQNYAAFQGTQENWNKQLQERLASAGQSISLQETLGRDAAALWTFCPMLPLDPETGEFEKRADGTPIPYRRFIWQNFGQDILAGTIIPVRVQDASFYGGDLPIYGSTHLEDLDSGAYGMSICETLMNYTVELSRCREQYILNKDNINSPTTWHLVGSPSFEQDVTKPNAKVEVNGPNDFGYRAILDATGTTVNMCEHLRERAQTTSKAVDALLGKAMGGRTTATEAQNAFQSAMSGVTTDINIFNFDTMGQYAKRVYGYATRWFDLDLVKAICGNYGLALTLEDMNIGLSMKFDVGSSFIESIVKQGHIRYFLEAGARSPALDQRVLFEALADELKIRELKRAIVPDGIEREIQKATEQSINTFLDKQVMIDPNQNHQIAVEVKMRYLEDQESVWMKEYGQLPYSMAPQFTRAMFLANQITVHQKWIELHMQQQMAEQIAGLQMTESGAKPDQVAASIPSLQNAGPTSQGGALSSAQQRPMNA